MGFIIGEDRFSPLAGAFLPRACLKNQNGPMLMRAGEGTPAGGGSGGLVAIARQAAAAHQPWALTNIKDVGVRTGHEAIAK